MNREELISKYSIAEEGLNELVKDLLALPDSRNNRNILVRALKGHYSDFGSTHAAPLMTLHADLGTVGYSNMQRKVEQGKYEHDAGPKKIIEDFQFEAKIFINEAGQGQSQGGVSVVAAAAQQSGSPIYSSVAISSSDSAITYKKENAPGKMLHNLPQSSFLDMCLDGPKYATVKRYKIVGDNYVTSFDIEQATSFTGNPFGNITNIQFTHITPDIYKETHTIAFDKNIPSMRLAGMVTPQPGQDALFLTYLTAKMPEEVKKMFIGDVVGDMGINGEKLKNEWVAQQAATSELNM